MLPPATQSAPVPHEIDFVGFGAKICCTVPAYASTNKVPGQPGYLSGASIVCRGTVTPQCTTARRISDRDGWPAG
jgi:hypothetical protein